MRKFTEDSVTKDITPEKLDQPLASPEPLPHATDRFSIAGNGRRHLNAQGQDPDDAKRYELSEAPPEAVPRSEKLIRVDSASFQLHQSIYPAVEAELPLQRLDPRLVAFHDFDPQAVAPYNRLVISLISAAASRKLQRVLITSAQHGDGRTSVTLNLAAALARARQRVLVVESDFLRPSSLRVLGVDVEAGFAEVVTKGLPLGRAMVRLQPIGFNLLPTRAQVENSAELLASPVFESMMQMLRPDYDFILFDSAPLLAVADACLLQLYTDATLLVIRPGCTSTSQMAKAVALLNENLLLGVVLNRVAI
jgi:capsular exopolysaccharide synthesis family protein